MQSLLRNAARLLSSPDLLRDYLLYQGSRLRNRGRAVRMLPQDIRVTGFSCFSEFHSLTDQVSPRERAFLTSHPLPDGPIVDVWANLGVVSLILAHRVPSRPVHAFEPHPSTVQALKQNAALNDAKNVTVHEAAVGREDTTVMFGAHPQERATAQRITKIGEHTVEVSGVSLDQWAESRGIDSISLLKVDVEGYEKAVFEGAESLLRDRRVGLVYFEVCPSLSREAGFDPSGAAALLEECGYSLHQLTPEGALAAVELETIAEVELENWVALRPESRKAGSNRAT